MESLTQSLTPKPGIREHYRHIAAQSQCGSMSAAGESRLCIAFTAWTLRAITSAAVARMTLRQRCRGRCSA